MKKNKKNKLSIKPIEKKTMAISNEALYKFQAPQKQKLSFPIKPPDLPNGVIPKDADMAMDANINDIYQYANSYYARQGFIGYQLLAEMSQKSEYRAAVSTIAKEMTRKWIKILSKGDDDLSDKIEKIEAAFIKYKVRDVFRVAIEQDGFFGRANIFIDIKDQADIKENPLVIDSKTIKQGSLVRLKNIEAMWTTPYQYNSIDPTTPDFFKPTKWFIMGKQVHASRMLTIISREVPDMLKPAYNFGGMSLAQLMMTDVEHYYRTRDSISDLVHSFSISGIKTDLQSILAGGSGDSEMKRAQLFNQIRDNRGLMLIDHELEEFFQFNTPLTGLDELQTQAKEQMAAPAHIPLVKMFGITPGGLNASSEGEIRVFYDEIAAEQENILRDPLEKVLQIIQLSEFGEIDENICFEFEPLMELTEREMADVQQIKVNNAVALINTGVISPQEARETLAGDMNSGYSNIDVDDLPEPINLDLNNESSNEE